jgi:hypothetical protein
VKPAGARTQRTRRGRGPFAIEQAARHFCRHEADVRTIRVGFGRVRANFLGSLAFSSWHGRCKSLDMRNLSYALDGDWSRVSETSPCPICGSDRSCRTHVDEAFVCCVQRPSDWRLTNGGWLHRVHSTASQIVSRLAQQPENLSTDWKALPTRPGAHP